MRQKTRCHAKRAITLRETVVIVIVLALCVALIPMTLLRRTELQRRVACAANLKAIETALWTYADQNGDDWPVAGHAPATKDRVGEVEYVRAIGSYRGRADDPQAGNTFAMKALPTRLSTTRNLWTLYRLGMVTRDKFICPSTKDVANTEPNATVYWDFGIGDLDGPATPEQSRVGYRQISYGYQVPYGKHFRPSSDIDRYWPVADKGPFGAALEADAAMPPLQIPARHDPKLWRAWNSPNHGGEVQVVLSGGHGTELHTSPVGWQNDIAYTQSPSRANGLQPRQIYGGTPPDVGLKLTPDPGGPKGWDVPDTLIYP